MKAIVVRQPWATLIALGLKVIETRPAPPNGPMRPQREMCAGSGTGDFTQKYARHRADRWSCECSHCGQTYCKLTTAGYLRDHLAGVRGLPGLAIERGERIAIVAGATAPRVGEPALGHWFGDTPLDVVDAFGSGAHIARHRGTREWFWFQPEGDLQDLPLGAVVCTAVVADTLPIVPNISQEDGMIWAPQAARSVLRSYATSGDTWGVDLASQRPLGDFTPGRWGWMLADVQPCDPIPCKGKEGVFALPADVAEQVTP